MVVIGLLFVWILSEFLNAELKTNRLKQQKATLLGSLLSKWALDNDLLSHGTSHTTIGAVAFHF